MFQSIPISTPAKILKSGLIIDFYHRAKMKKRNTLKIFKLLYYPDYFIVKPRKRAYKDKTYHKVCTTNNKNAKFTILYPTLINKYLTTKYLQHLDHDHHLQDDQRCRYQKTQIQQHIDARIYNIKCLSCQRRYTGKTCGN